MVYSRTARPTLPRRTSVSPVFSWFPSKRGIFPELRPFPFLNLSWQNCLLSIAWGSGEPFIGSHARTVRNLHIRIFGNAPQFSRVVNIGDSAASKRRLLAVFFIGNRDGPSCIFAAPILWPRMPGNRVDLRQFAPGGKTIETKPSICPTRPHRWSQFQRLSAQDGHGHYRNWTRKRVASFI